MSLSEAARRSGRSVRTLQRWIEEGLLESLRHPADRRRRLVSIAGLDRVGEQLAEPAEAPTKADRRLDADRQAVSEAARRLYQQTSTTAAELGVVFEDLSDDMLAETPFAQQLWILIDAVRGYTSEPPDAIRDALERVVVTLFSDPMTRNPVVPDRFWSGSLIGRHAARAKLLLYSPTTVVSLNEIVETTGLPRRRVENILRDLAVERIYDPDEARGLYPSEVINAVRSWTADHSMASEQSFEVSEDRQGEQPGIGVAFSKHLLAESRTQIKAVRTEYHRQFFPLPRDNS